MLQPTEYIRKSSRGSTLKFNFKLAPFHREDLPCVRGRWLLEIFPVKNLWSLSQRAVTFALGKKHAGPDFPSSVAALDLNWPDDPKIGLFPPVTNWACHRCILAPRCAARYHFPQTLWQIGPNESSRATKRAYGGRTLRSSRNALSRAIRPFSLQTSVKKSESESVFTPAT